MTDSKTYSCYIEFPAKYSEWPDMFPKGENPCYPTDSQPFLPKISPSKENYDWHKIITERLKELGLNTENSPYGWTSTPTSYTVELQVPGFKRTDITIEIKDGVLTAKASRADKKYTDKTKVLTLPKDANPDAVSAKLEDGILTITVSKVAPPVAKKIEIS